MSLSLNDEWSIGRNVGYLFSPSVALRRQLPRQRELKNLRRKVTFIFSDDIYAAAVILAGAESEGLAALCSAAEREFTARLRAGVTPEMCREVLITASAMLAVSMHGYVKDGDGITSYKAGDIEVKRGENSQGSREVLQRQAEVLMQPYISDGDFCFMGVRG